MMRVMTGAKSGSSRPSNCEVLREISGRMMLMRSNFSCAFLRWELFFR